MARDLGTIGEHGLIERIERQARRLRAPQVVLAIGDDAAILRPRAGEDLVVTSDALVEDVHFRWRSQSPVVVGRRALVANLSDLAAMGARPLGFTLALQAPKRLPLERCDGILRGLLAEARRHACPLVGGNLASARETSLVITAFGAVRRGRALRRDALAKGDRVFVTGTLGGAALALARSERGTAPLRRVPTPRLGTGLALSRLRGRGACIDVSDGLASDLGHLVAGRPLGIEIEARRVPRPRGFDAACRKLSLDPDALCFGGGEDYELLFTLRRSVRMGEVDLERRLAAPIREIGRVVAQPGLHGLPDGVRTAGWRHF